MGTRQKQRRAERPGRASTDARRRKEPQPEKPRRWFVVLWVRDVTTRERYNLSTIVIAETEFEAGKRFRQELRAMRKDLDVLKTVSITRDNGRKAAWRNLPALGASPTDPDGPRAA